MYTSRKKQSLIIVDLLCSHNGTYMVQFGISPSQVFEIELCESVVSLPVTG